MNNVLVTGATGFIGRQLIKELIRNNIQVTAVVRSQKKSLKLFQEINNLNLVCCEMSKIYKFIISYPKLYLNHKRFTDVFSPAFPFPSEGNGQKWNQPV